jgi:hypothetical protein
MHDTLNRRLGLLFALEIAVLALVLLVLAVL